MEFIEDIGAQRQSKPMVVVPGKVPIANLRRAPSLQTINSVLEYQDEQGSEQTGRMLQDLKTAVASMRKEDSRFKCRRCGFKSNTLYWMCPGCHNWASVKPCCLNESV